MRPGLIASWPLAATWPPIASPTIANTAIYRYNNANEYVQAVDDYAAIIAEDPAAFAGYHRWDVYYDTTDGDVLLPIGYVATSPIPSATT